jgi:RNA 3'-terminal phosphate cyclase (ATP)
MKLNCRPQHLMGVQLLRDLSCGKLENDEVGSTEISLFPGTIRNGKFVADIKTAG